MENWRKRISVNPAVCHGAACVRGTRLMVSVVLDHVAAGVSRREICESYPGVEDADIDAALASMPQSSHAKGRRPCLSSLGA